jgi:hypothetical protein
VPAATRTVVDAPASVSSLSVAPGADVAAAQPHVSITKRPQSVARRTLNLDPGPLAGKATLSLAATRMYPRQECERHVAVGAKTLRYPVVRTLTFE